VNVLSEHHSLLESARLRASVVLSLIGVD
jgi:hypothetical protein